MSMIRPSDVDDAIADLRRAAAHAWSITPPRAAALLTRAADLLADLAAELWPPYTVTITCSDGATDDARARAQAQARDNTDEVER